MAGKKELWNSRESAESSTGRIWLDRGGIVGAAAGSATSAGVGHAATASIGASTAGKASFWRYDDAK